MWVSAEFFFSHRYVDANGNRTSVAAFDSAAYSVATDNQNSSSAHAEKAVCYVRAEEDLAGRPAALMTGDAWWRW